MLHLICTISVFYTMAHVCTCVLYTGVLAYVLAFVYIWVCVSFLSACAHVCLCLFVWPCLQTCCKLEIVYKYCFISHSQLSIMVEFHCCIMSRDLLPSLCQVSKLSHRLQVVYGVEIDLGNPTIVILILHLCCDLSNSNIF